MTPCQCPACQANTDRTLDGVEWPRMQPRPVYWQPRELLGQMTYVPPSWREWCEWEGENT